MKVKDIINILSKHYSEDDELIIDWWDKEIFDECLLDGNNERIDVPEDVWSFVVSRYEMPEHFASTINEDVIAMLKDEMRKGEQK